VWLASVALHHRSASGPIVPTERWVRRTGTINEAHRLIEQALSGVGDPAREREFRMCVSLCRHRALTEEEAAGLPDWWHDAPAKDVAGGPLEVLWQRGIPRTLSCEPCESPRRRPLPGYSRSSGVYIVDECGTCPSCRARAACHA
jgi:hypothetical protein